MLDQAVDELLEQEEKKALQKQASSKRPTRPTPEPVENVPHRDTRHRSSGRDPYSDEREKNNARRSSKSARDQRSDDTHAKSAGSAPDRDGDEEMKDADGAHGSGSSHHGSANGSVRSRHHHHSNRSRSPGPNRRRSPSHRDSSDSYRRREYSPSREDDDDRYYRPRGGDRGGRGNRDHDNDRRNPDRRDPRRDIDRYSGGGRDRRDDRHARPRSPRPARKPRTPEPTDDERDRRTVFVQQLAARLRTRELQNFFEQVGPVVEAQIVKDRVSGRSKGVGYVEFKEEDSVQKAIQLTGQKLLGIPIIAQLTEAEKNRQARTTEGAATQSNGIPFHRLYVGNIHFSITEEDLKNVFEPFGELEFVQLQKEEQGRSKGYGFVQFVDPAQAKEALEKMNGFELAGRPIRVGLGNDKFTPESTHSLLQRFGSQAQQAAHNQQNQHQPTGSSFSGLGGRGAHAGGTGNFDKASSGGGGGGGGGRDAEKGGGASALDDTDVAGVNFSNYSRDALMRKLARVDEDGHATTATGESQSSATKMAAPAKRSAAAAPAIPEPAPTRCVLLKNLYNPADETAPNWQAELEEDVRAECEEKYGHVVHIGVSRDGGEEGEIYVKFDRVEGGVNAIRGLNGRWFGGRVVRAGFVVEAVYHVNFPKAGNV
ncbi:Phosphatidylinositol-3-phosphatase SAC1 [Teratosphaeriaceae sp. CCFEE 6253]|nr:Phosphatidylinositol-3-phosphatase SAC1 [Teratosphaeriaceae sp. CCFEE 6253]